MTLSTTANKVSYAGDGATVSFAIPFLFLENGHVEAILRDAAGDETIWAFNTQFTLSGAGAASGGTLTVSTSPTDYTPASGETLVIRRVVPETQDTDYPEGGAFPAAAHEQALDKLTMLVQQHSEEIARAPVLPVSSSLTDITVPEPGALEIIRWNAGGTALETASISDLSLSVPTEVLSESPGEVLVYDGAVWKNRGLGELNALDYDAAGDGTTDDRAAIAAGVTAAASQTLFFPAGTYLVNSALTLSAGVAYRFANGAKLKPANGVTITIDGYIDAGHWQIFDLSAGGSVVLGTSSAVVAPFDTDFPQLNDEVSVAWFGANGQNDGADDTAAFQAAVDAREYSMLEFNRYNNCKVKVPPGMYRVADVLCGQSLWIEGCGPQTLIQPSAHTTDAMFVFREGQVKVTDCHFDGRGDDGITTGCMYFGTGTSTPITEVTIEDTRYTHFAGLVTEIENADLVSILRSRWEGGDEGQLRLDDVDGGLVEMCQFEMSPTDSGPVEQYVEVTAEAASPTSQAIRFQSCWFEATGSEAVKRGILLNASCIVMAGCRTNFDTDYGSFVAHVEVGAKAEFIVIENCAFTNNGTQILNVLAGANNILLKDNRGLNNFGNITNDSNSTGIYITNVEPGTDQYEFKGKKLAFIDRSEVEQCALTDAGPEVKGQLLQSFTLMLFNNAGTLQHRIVGDNWNNTPGSFHSKINGASSIFANTPTGTDGSTAMATGGKVGSANTNHFSFDTAAQTGADFIGSATRDGNTTTTDIFARAFFESIDINGVTRSRLTIGLFQTSDGAAFAINTTNIGAGQQVRIQFNGYVA